MIDELPDGPDPATDAPAVFSQKAAASVLAQKNMVSQFNASVAAINALFAGGAYAIPYTFDSGTAAADPGAGKLRLNNVAQSSATALHLDPISSAAQDVTALLDQFDASTSTVKGKLRLVRTTDPSKWLTFDVTVRTSPVGYRTLTISSGSGSATSPFVNGDPLVLFFQRTGDKGDTGPLNVYPYAQFAEQYASATAGGPTGTGAVDRSLNAVAANTIPSASLSSGTITLPAGTYEVRAISCVAGNSSTRNQALLYNVTDGVYPIIGTSNAGGSNENTLSHLSGRITIAATKTFKLRTWIGAVASTWGLAAGSGFVETYANIEFWKLS